MTPDLLTSIESDSAWIEFTSDCDIRCLYCYSVQPGYERTCLDHAHFDALVETIIRRKTREVYVNGHGETTSMQGWQEVVRRFLGSGTAVKIISHLGRHFSDDETETLSRLSEITTSFDTLDPDLFRRIRRGADPLKILYNMGRIRARAIRDGRKPPSMAWDIVVMDKNIFQLKELVAFGLSYGVTRFVFCNYVEYPSAQGKLAHVATLPFEQLQEVQAILEDSFQLIQDSGATFHCDAGLKDAVRERLEAGTQAEQPTRMPAEEDAWDRKVVHSGHQRPGQTRFCYQPWRLIFVQSNGNVLPCLFSRHAVGSLKEAPLEDILNGERILAYRKGLLTGNLQPECQSCSQTCWIDREAFRLEIQRFAGA